MVKKDHFKQKSEIVMVPRSMSGQREQHAQQNRGNRELDDMELERNPAQLGPGRRGHGKRGIMKENELGLYGKKLKLP